MTDIPKFGNRDIVQTVSPDVLGQSTRAASNNLYRQLTYADENFLSKADKDLRQAVMLEIQNNLQNYDVTDNAKEFASQHNALHETYKDLFCKLKIGINFQVELSMQDFKTNSEVDEQFKNTYKEIITNPESYLNRYVNSKEFYLLYKTKHILLIIGEYLNKS